MLYAILLNINHEIEYIWLKPFSFPAFLFIITRYAPLIAQALAPVFNALPMSLVSCTFSRNSVKALIFPSQYCKALCFNYLTDLDKQKVVWYCRLYSWLYGNPVIYWYPRLVTSELVFLQKLNTYLGLLVTRAYSLCQGKKIITAALVFIFIGGTILNLIRKERLISVKLCESHFL